MNKMKNGECCSVSTGCCGTVEEVKSNRNILIIDFLYLDLSVCTRCQGAENNLDDALEEVAKVIEATGTDVKVNKINVNTKQLAATHKFLSSPTIRVNDQDIQMEFKESLCESCGDFCGDSVDCRVWIYKGEEYTEPPKAMIIEGILKVVYGGVMKANLSEMEYVMPENLAHFYDVMNRK